MKFSLSLAVHVNYTCTCVHACVHVLRVSYLCNHYSFNEPHCYPTINIFLIVFPVVFAYRVHSGQEELCTATVEALNYCVSLFIYPCHNTFFEVFTKRISAKIWTWTSREGLWTTNSSTQRQRKFWMWVVLLIRYGFICFSLLICTSCFFLKIRVSMVEWDSYRRWSQCIRCSWWFLGSPHLYKDLFARSIQSFVGKNNLFYPKFSWCCEIQFSHTRFWNTRNWKNTVLILSTM